MRGYYERKPRFTKEWWDSKTVKGENGCVIWIKGKFHFGHGAIKIGSKTMKAHRVAWIHRNGEIPEGMCICHKCDNPSCVNVDHMFLGTKGDNNSDRDRKGRTFHPIGSLHPMSRINESDVINIRKMHAKGKSSAEISNKFGISRSHCNCIIAFRKWKHLQAETNRETK